MYKKHKYYTRKPVASYKHKTSKHIVNAQRIYNVKNLAPNKELATKTGCSVAALKAIVRKGEGAYYSSGSRPNQTAQSWGIARMASSITGGKAAKVDFHIIKTCDHKKQAYKLASQKGGRAPYRYSSERYSRIPLYRSMDHDITNQEYMIGYPRLDDIDEFFIRDKMNDTIRKYRFDGKGYIPVYPYGRVGNTSNKHYLDAQNVKRESNQYEFYTNFR